MSGKIRSTILSTAAGFAIMSFSGYANAQSCTPGSFNDFNVQVASDSKRVGPDDCAVVRLATPILTWAQKSDRDVNQQYKIEVKGQTNTFARTYYRPDPRVLIMDPLAAGTYEWKVTYYKAGGAAVMSQSRRFIIPAGSYLSIPTGANLAAQVAAKGHPRTRVGSTTFARVAELARTEFNQSFSAFMAEADRLALIPNDQLPSVPPNRTRDYFVQTYGAANADAEYSKWLLDLRKIAMAQVREIKILGYAFHFTGSAFYQNKGLARLERLADWPSNPGDATSHQVQDQANREIFLALALGMDLFSDALGSSTYASWQTKIVASFKKRLGQVDFSSFNTYPKDSHLVTVARYAMEAMMYAVGTPGMNDTAAKNLFAKHWEMWITTLGSWGESYDGGFGNGEFYGWMNALGVIQGATTARLVANVDLTQWELVSKTGDYLIGITPAKILTRQHFGDSYETNNNYQQYGKDVRLLAMLSKKPAHDWYWRMDSGNILYKHLDLGVEHYLVLALNNGAPDFSTNKDLGLPNSYEFAQAGFVAMHSSTTDPYRSSVLFRSSAFGAFSHNHADQNSFTFTSKGQPLLINAGYYDYSGSVHHLFVTRSTRFKNALTFNDGIGQAERTNDGNPTYPGIPLDSAEPRGRITRFSDNGTWAVATGDASLAYQGFDPNVATSTWKRYLTNAYRTVAYNRKLGVIVVYDYASSSVARQWELNYHTINAPAIQSTGSVMLSNNGATACLDVYGSGRTFKRSQFSQWPNLPGRYYDEALVPANKGNPAGSVSWDSLVGKPVAPTASASRPLQNHIIFYDPNKTTSVAAVTVIRENCQNTVSVTWGSATQASVRINGGSAFIADGTGAMAPAQ